VVTTQSDERLVVDAVAAARSAQPAWAKRTAVERGGLVREIALALQARREEASRLVAAETGKPLQLALGETDGAIEMGFFVAGEGRRLYGRTTTSAMPNRTVMARRRPVGVAALIVSFNTPLPNYAWKVFPAVLCGNAAVLKPSEHTTQSAGFFVELCNQILPEGVLALVQGGSDVGATLVEHPDVDLVSFTGSAETGRRVNERAGRRLAKVCLELGGKNALVVCDDADLDRAVEWSLASAFSNAGQRCASASRLIVFDAVYDEFRARLVADACDYESGPVISDESLERILGAIDGAKVAAGGGRRVDRPGPWLEPTILEDVDPAADLSCAELFGPVTILYRVRDLDDAIALANDSPFGLTAAIHTASIHRAMRFADEVEAGVVVVNGGTFGSEPHMGFGGVKQSGTGWREAGVEALDVYSEWQYVNLIADPQLT
jgi:acyl-CoA reductase-like NAD-dependent aldehyde dehydrogenase